jgi:hypothetical protein
MADGKANAGGLSDEKLEELSAAQDLAGEEELEEESLEEEDTEEEEEELEEEDVEEEEESEEEEEEPQDQPTRTRLGRKVAELTRTVELLVETMNKQPQPVEESDEENADIPMTKKEVDAYLKKKEDDKKVADSKYSASYISHVINLGEGMDEAFFEEIYNELMDINSEFNVKHSNNPKADAELNFYRTKASILEKQTKTKTKKRINVKGKKSRDGKVSGKVDTSQEQPKINWSADELELIERFPKVLTEEKQLEVAKVLGKIK